MEIKVINKTNHIDFENIEIGTMLIMPQKKYNNIYMKMRDNGAVILFSDNEYSIGDSEHINNDDCVIPVKEKQPLEVYPIDMED